MLQGISSLYLKGYFAVTNFVRSFKDDERGLSGVVVTVLLILIAVLAIVAIWGALDGWLGRLWTQITGQAGTIQGRDSY